jgi:uncharacterized repeat protein (TIGR01451 family)
LTGIAAAAPPAITTTTDSATPGSGSLRAAIMAASPGDTVVVPASISHYKVTLGEIPIANAITVQGAGASSTIIDAAGASRVFQITGGVPTTGTVTFKDLMITGGSATVVPGGGGILADSGALVLDGVTMTGNSVNLTSTLDGLGGGAVYSNGSGVTVTNSSLTGNAAALDDAPGFALGGAAIFEDTPGPITISGSTISANRTTITAAHSASGGAIYQASNAAVTVSNSHLDNNVYTETNGTNCCSGGAAIYQHGGSNGTTSITSSTLNGNVANITDTNCCDGGGAIFSESNGPVTLTASTLNHNATTVTSGNCCSGGGAISAFSAVLATNSTLDSNTATVTDAKCCDGGGAVLVDTGSATNSGSQLVNTEMSGNMTTVTSTGTAVHSCCNGGGAFNNDVNSSSLTILSSDISGNQSHVNSTNDSGGGGIYAADGLGDVITNSTVSGNSSTNAAGTGGGGGGIMFDFVGTTDQLTFDTIAGNTVSGGAGGGVFADNLTVDTKNSIIALNTASSGANCAGTTPTLTSLGHNLENTPDSCNFIAAGDKVLPSASVGLGPLANNGGPTMTRSLLSGSAAIDAIPFASCTDQATPTPQPVTTDQRGVTRPQPAGGNCDIGAYEFGSADIALSASAAPTTLKVGQQATFTFAVSNAGPVFATNTAIKLTLPAGLKFVSGSAGQGSCAGGAPGAMCSLGVVAAGSPAKASVVVQATAPGTMTVTANASATEPDATPADNAKSITLTATATPTITHSSESHKTWREALTLAMFSRKQRKPPIGTTFKFTLNEQAKVSFAFTQTTKRKHHHKATKTRGTLSFNGHAGVNKVVFYGGVSHSKMLKPGSYTVVITARAFGKTSRAVKLRFTIVRG